MSMHDSCNCAQCTVQSIKRSVYTLCSYHSRFQCISIEICPLFSSPLLLSSTSIWYRNSIELNRSCFMCWNFLSTEMAFLPNSISYYHSSKYFFEKVNNTSSEQLQYIHLIVLLDNVIIHLKLLLLLLLFIIDVEKQ